MPLTGSRIYTQWSAAGTVWEGDGTSRRCSLHERSASCRMDFCKFTALSSSNVLSLLPVYGWRYDLSESGSTKAITDVLLDLFHHLYQLIFVLWNLEMQYMLHMYLQLYLPDELFFCINVAFKGFVVIYMWMGVLPLCMSVCHMHC